MSIQIEDEFCVNTISVVAVVGVVAILLLGCVSIIRYLGYFSGPLFLLVIGWCMCATYKWDSEGYFVVRPVEEDDEEDL